MDFHVVSILRHRSISTVSARGKAADRLQGWNLYLFNVVHAFCYQEYDHALRQELILPKAANIKLFGFQECKVARDRKFNSKTVLFSHLSEKTKSDTNYNTILVHL